MKTIYEQDEHLTPEGLTLFNDACLLLKKFFDDHPDYPIREVSHILFMAVNYVEADNMLARVIENIKVNRKPKG